MATSLEDRSYPHPFSVPELDPVLPDDLVWEILIWLPVKSLMRFKCVSKLWKSIILNPSFASAYRGGFRGILIDEPYFWRFSLTRDFFYLNLFDDDDETVEDDNGLNSFMDDEIADDDNGIVCKSGSIKYLSYNHTVEYGSGRELGSTSIVNGLVCFYVGNYSCLYNVATRETMELPLSQYDNQNCTYYLGFDPANKLYKLLKICPIYDEEDEDFNDELIDVILIRNLDCEILTLGIDKSWRNIDAAPCEICARRSVCFDGVLYWLGPRSDDGDYYEYLVAFHLAQEKFEFISTSQSHSIWGVFLLPRFAPGLAMMAVYDGEVDIIRYGKGVGWGDRQKFKLPGVSASDFDPDFFEAKGILPDGKVFILYEESMMDRPFTCFLYDPMEKKYTSVAIHKSPSSPSSIMFQRYITGYFFYFEENIIPLSCV